MFGVQFRFSVAAMPFQASLAPKLHLEEVLDSETYKNEFVSEVSLEKVV